MNMIERHAFLSAGVKQCHASGQPVPPQVLQELNRIETRAQASMTPMELNQAMHASISMQAQWMERHRQQGAMKEGKERHYQLDKFTKELLGYDAAQTMAQARGEKFEVRNEKQRPLKEVQSGVEELAKHAGLKDRKQLDKLAEQYEKLRNAGGKKEAQRIMAEKHSDKVAQVLHAYTDTGADLAVGLRERLGATAEPVEVEPSDDEHLRAQIVESVVEVAQDEPDTFNHFATSESDVFADREDRLGDVARAYDHHEAFADAAERADYV